MLDSLAVEPGEVTVRLTRTGYVAWERQYRVREGQTLNVPARLAPVVEPQAPAQTAVGRLTMQAVPQGTMSVQDEACEVGTPCTVRAGTRTVTCSHAGYEATQRVRVQADGQSALTCFTEQKIVVQVRTEEGNPIWATILVDGEAVGQFPDKVLTLTPGDHRIEVRRTEYEVLNPPQTVQIRPSFEEKQHLLVFQIRRP